MQVFIKVLLLITLGLPLQVFAQTNEDETLFNCYTIIVGKDATVDGSVLMGHNEDDWGEQMLSMYIVPSRRYESGDMLEIEGNVSIPQESSSARYFWIEMIAQHYADVYMNEYGVAVVSNRCTSREDREDYTDGGISYTLRRAVAERATTARKAMEMIGEMVEKYGYSSTGRTYSVADDKEAWVVSVVQGRRWIAQRVGDDKVMMMPNYYTIDKIDLNDKENFRASSDIISYAVERGWYDSQRDGEFSFRNVYSDEKTLNSENNMGRKWGGLRYLTKTKYELTDEFPFQFQPKHKINVEMMTEILSDHFEGTPMDRVKSTNPGDPHSKKGSICNLGTQSSVVFQLRDLPSNVGAIMWTAMYSPCRQVYLPWYMGTDYLPSGYGAISNPIIALDNHFSVKKDFKDNYPLVEYWKFLDYSKYIGENYVERMDKYAPKLEKLQRQIYKSHEKFDKNINAAYKFYKLKGIPNIEEFVSEEMGVYTRKYHNKMMKIVKSRK